MESPAQRPEPPWEAQQPRRSRQQEPGGGPMPAEFQTPQLFRLESDVHDCQVTGKIPEDLSGAFYRVGPDAQYPMNPRNIPFDGEGHVGMFRIKDGRADYKTRYVKNDRWQAQNEAGKILFPDVSQSLTWTTPVLRV